MMRRLFRCGVFRLVLEPRALRLLHCLAGGAALQLIEPALAQSADCALTEADRSEIRKIISRLPSVSYSWGAFPGPSSRDLDFPANTKVGDLLDRSGGVFLFRDIAGPYEKGFKGEYEKNYIEREEGRYSYSLSPAIVKIWAYGGDGKVTIPADYPDGNKNIGPNAVTLIAWQNISQELYYKNYEGHIRQEPLVASLSLDTIFYEVKVPISVENVVLTINQLEFAGILDSFGGRGKKFSLRDFLERILESARARSPRC